MARYDREFLVPYLEDICALHLSKRKINEKIAAFQKKISNINCNAMESVKKPSLEAYKGDTDLTGTGMGCLGACCGLLGIILLSAYDYKQPATLVLPLGFMLAGIVIILRSFGEKGRTNARIKERNEERERDYALAQAAALMVVEPEVEAVKTQISVYEAEIKRIDGLLETLYNVNVIPRWYRGMYPAVYLYDWFSTGRSDDMDMALNTFVLEQIKDRLDTIIHNQSEMIINQRIMIANQQKSMEQQERHHAVLMAKLDRISASNEERNMYLSMIEANTAANAYFTAADYLKN